jgi:hypothetical protein
MSTQTLKIGTQYIITQGDRYIFDGVYTHNVRGEVYYFNGGSNCRLRLNSDDLKKLTLTPDPITA